MVYLGYGFLQSKKGSRYSLQNIDRYLPDMSIDVYLLTLGWPVDQVMSVNISNKYRLCAGRYIDWHVDRYVDQGVPKLHKIQKF